MGRGAQVGAPHRRGRWNRFTTGWDHAGDSVASGEGGLGLGSFLRAGTRAVSAFSSQALGGDAVHKMGGMRAQQTKCDERGATGLNSIEKFD